MLWQREPAVTVRRAQDEAQICGPWLERTVSELPLLDRGRARAAACRGARQASATCVEYCACDCPCLPTAVDKALHVLRENTTESIVAIERLRRANA